MPSEWTIETPDVGTRLDVFLTRQRPDFSRSRLQALLKNGAVTVSGRLEKASWILRAGDAVVFTPPEAVAPAVVAAEEIPLDILYEDESLLVLNKPPDIVVHPGAGNASGTLVNALLHHCGGLSVIGGVERPGIVHRLDKETSGCLVVAKNDAVHRDLAAAFASRSVQKTYVALVEGVPRFPHGQIEAPIGRHPIHRQKMAVVDDGRPAHTSYRLLGSEGKLALVECQPHTGRTHQIRVHLKHLGHPVAGDPVYGHRHRFTRHMLHAWKLEFTHPALRKKVAFCAPLTADFPEWARDLLKKDEIRACQKGTNHKKH
jgi:23S rRNA pseudouridine1911/1915/1917 synthase